MVEAGALYELLSHDCGLSRERAKKAVFRDVLFGKPYVNGRVTVAFGKRWPTLLAGIRAAKRHDHKIIARALQRLESRIILDGIGARLVREMPSLHFLTIHDSALLVAEHAETVKAIMVDEFARWGVRPKLHVKSGGEPEKKVKL